MTPHLDELISIVNHPAIQGRRGEWLPGDRYWIKSYHLFSLIVFDPEQIPNHAIWLPPFSDPIQPERGLMGMVPCDNDGFSLVWKCCGEDHWGINFCSSYDHSYVVAHGPTPEIAVCKAIIAQSKEEK